MIIVGGEALIDLIVGAEGSLTAAPGGGPYNTARTIARLGLPVAFLGAISTDRFGERLVRQLTADGVADRLVVRTDAPTTLAIAELDATGAAAYRFYLAGTAAPSLTVEQADPERLADPTLTVTAVHVGTLGLAVEPLAGAMEALVARAPDDTVVVVDVNYRTGAIADVGAYHARLDRLFARADIVKASTADLRSLRPGMSPDAAVADLLARGPAVILWTDGAGPARIVTARGRQEVHPPAVHVVDTVGAGDAFGGGFLAAWIGSGRGRPELDSDDAIVAAVEHAVRVATVTCGRAGADPPTAAELAAAG